MPIRPSTEILLRRAHTLVFDFDGTLVDSNPIKRRAFERCFTGFSERWDEILAYCWGNHHVPRGEKFQHVYEEILQLPYIPEIAQDLQERFDRFTTTQIIEAKEMPGAEAFLRQASGRYRTGLLSSTPHEILLTILRGRGWEGLFTRVQGAPVQKAEWLMGLRLQDHLAKSELVFFGDSTEDAQAAQLAGCTFIAVGPDHRCQPAAARLRNFTTLAGSHHLRDEPCDLAMPPTHS